MITRSLTALGAALLICTSAPALAAPDAKSLELAKKHYALGQQLFDMGSLKSAVEEFKEAYRLTRNPLLLYNIGFVYDKLGDEAMALHNYEKFLSDGQDTPKTHAQREQVANRIAELKKAGAEDGATAPETTTTAAEPTPAPAEPPAPATPAAPAAKTPAAKATPVVPTPVAAAAGAFGHEILEEAPPGRPIDLTARAPAGWNVVLHYQSSSDGKFHDVAMKPRQGELVARIPAQAVRGAALHYYIDARNGASVLASSGTSETPNLIELDPSAKPHFFVDTPADQVAAKAAPVVSMTDDTGGSPDQDRPKSKYGKMKWIATGATVAMLGAGIAFYVQASNYASTLEQEAYASGHECGAPPCRTYNPDRAGLESTGHMYQTMSFVALGVGTAGIVASSILWYLDAKHKRQMSVAPVVGEGMVGAAVGGRF